MDPLNDGPIFPMHLDENEYIINGILEKECANAVKVTLDKQLQNLIQQHLTDPAILTMRKMFSNICETVDCRDVLIAEACSLLRASTPMEIMDLVGKVSQNLRQDKSRVIIYDDAVTDIIIGLHENDLLSGHYATMLLIKCNDLRVMVSDKKEKFIKTQLSETNYKSMKEILKCIFVEMNKIEHGRLNEQIFNNLRPFEEILLGLLDRNNARCPPILLIVEISRLAMTAPPYMYKRFCDAVENIVNSFRPLAIICEIIGQSFLFPIFSHPCIALTHQWLLEPSNKFPSKSFLPRSTIVQSPQTFLKYIFLKQPRLFVFDEKQLFPFHMLFDNTLHEVTDSLLLLILEAMAAMEEAEKSFEDHPLNQYNWQHISDICAYSLGSGRANFVQLLERLVAHLSLLKYRKARGELMRVVLQYLSVEVYAATKHEQQKNINFKFYPKLVELYNLLYPEDTVEIKSSDEPMKLVRCFAPTAIWLNLLSVKNTDVIIEPPPQLARYVNFIEELVNSNSNAEEEGFITVIANSYSGRAETFQKHFCDIVYRQIQKPLNTLPYWKLPYNKMALNGGKALDITLLSSLSYCAATELCKYLQTEWTRRMERRELPPPGLIETIARMTFIGDFKRTLKSMVNVFSDLSKHPSPAYNLQDYLILFSEFFSSRLKVIIDISNYPRMLCKTYDIMTKYYLHSGIHLQYYSAFELQFLKFFCYAPAYVFWQYIQVTNLYLEQQRGLKFLLFSPKTEIELTKMCAPPELYSIILLQYFRNHKLSVPTVNATWPVDNEYSRQHHDSKIMENHSISAATKKWIPEKFKAMKTAEFPTFSNLPNLISMIEQQDMHFFKTQDERYFMELNDKTHRLLLMLFLIIRNNAQQQTQGFPGFAYRLLRIHNSQYIILSTNILIDYIIFSFKEVDKEIKDSETSMLEKMRLVHCVNNFIFYFRFITLDRFLLQLVAHPNDDESIKIALEFAQLLLCENNQEVDGRFNFLLEHIPSYYEMSFCNSQNFFMAIKEYYDHYPEPSYLEQCTENFTHEEHIPIYYSNLMDKLLPIVDHIFHRAIEQELDDHIFLPLINRLAVVYKYHPLPVGTIYRMLYPFPSELIQKDSVREFVRQVALLDSKHPYYMLSETFIENYHTASAIDVCKTLINRLSRASNYKHQPPEFCSRDWRFAEMSPGAAVLTGANIELMISKYSVEEIVNALLECAFERPLDKPFEVLNSIALILTTLPSQFQQYYANQQLNILDLPELSEEDNPKKMLESFSKDAYTASENRPLAALALLHAFLQHCQVNSLQLLVDTASKLQEKVKTESQLFFVVRFVTPFFTRIEEIDSLKHPLCVVIYQAIANCITHKGRLIYEDVFCDLLFHIKYSVSSTGAFFSLLKEKVEGYMKHFPPEMLEKLRFLHSALPGETLEAETSTQTQPKQRLPAMRTLSSHHHQHALLQHQPSQQHMSHVYASMNLPIPGQQQQPQQQIPTMDPRIMQAQHPDQYRGGGQFMDSSKIMTEMVQPPIRADMLPEYQPNMVRPPHPTDMSTMQQQQFMHQQRMNQMRMQGGGMPPGGPMQMNMMSRFGGGPPGNGGGGMMPPNTSTHPAMMNQMISPHYMQQSGQQQPGGYMNHPQNGPPMPPNFMPGNQQQPGNMPSMSESGMMPPNYPYNSMGPQGPMGMMNQGGGMMHGGGGGGQSMGGMMPPNQGQMMPPGYGFGPPQPGGGGGGQQQQMRPNMPPYSMPPRGNGN